MKGWKESCRRILITVTVIYVLFCVCSCALQRKLLYFPTKIPADAIEVVAKEHGFVSWKNPAGQIIGWKIPADGAAIGSVLIVHGNAGCALGRDYIARPIHEMGAPGQETGTSNKAVNLDVFVLEYPGYGARDGSPSKKSLVAAGEEAFQLMPAGLPKYIVSESIGTGVACEVAKNHPAEVAGMTLFVPYHNLAVVAQKHFPFLPAYFLLADRFNPEACLKSYHGPIKFVIAEKDEVVGAATGKKLFNGYAGPKDLQIFPGAGHNDVSGQPPSWWREVFEFWQKNKAQTTP